MAKHSSTQKLSLGIFVILGTFFFVLVIYTIGQKQNMFGKTFSISAQFQNVNGLQEGNNVRYSGINIGTVTSIEMINDSTIKVDMNLDEKIISHLKKDAIATIGSDGLVGNMLVNITPGNKSVEPIKNGDTIISYSKIGAEDILNTLSTTNENAAILMSDLLKITTDIIEGKGTFGVLINDTIMASDLKKTISNLKNVSKSATISFNEFNTIISSLKTNDKTLSGVLLNDTISGENLKSTLKNLNHSSTKIDSTITKLNSLLNTLQSENGALNYVTQDSILVQKLKSSMKNINEGTDKFNENMEALKHNFLFRRYFKKLEKKNSKKQQTAK